MFNKPAVKMIISALVGGILGVIGARYLFVSSYLSLIPWGIAGLLIGLWSANTKAGAINGGVYGFLLAFIFMWAGYQGKQAVVTRLPFFALLGLIGASCGIALGIIGGWGKRLIRRQ